MPTDAELDAIIDAVAPALGLAPRPEWREAIRTHLRISIDHALNVAAFALPDDSEPAPVFWA